MAAGLCRARSRRSGASPQLTTSYIRQRNVKKSLIAQAAGLFLWRVDTVIAEQTVRLVIAAFIEQSRYSSGHDEQKTRPMNKSAKSALLSALVFPGIGHLYLRSYARGGVLVAIAVAALADFIHRAWQEAELVREQLTAEINASGVVDLGDLIAHATTAADRIDNKPFTLAGGVLIACWLIGIFDSYRIGKKLDAITTSDLT